MYYAHFILNKKGPLAKIWLAAHWDKKLTKAQIYETNIESTIETILEPQMKLALRTSGHLLLGVCRIYSRKVKYLLADCNEAFVKIKLAFRPGLIDLPKEKQQASVEAITLPEKFPEYINFTDINMEDIDLSKNITQQARVEDITLKEDFGTYVTTQDDDFGDMGSFGLDMDTFMMSDMERGRRLGHSLVGNDNMGDDFFGDALNEQSAFDMDELTKRANNESRGIDLNDINMEASLTDKIADFNADLDHPGIGVTDDTLLNDLDNDTGIPELAGGVVPDLFEDQPTVNPNGDEPSNKVPRLSKINESGDGTKEDEEGKKDSEAPVVEKQVRTRRRKKLIIDDIKEIDSSTMKSQLSDTSGILGTLELAPPTRKLMQLKESGGVDKLFSLTSRPLHCRFLQKLYTRNMTTKSLADITNKHDKHAKDAHGHSFANSILAQHDMSIEAMRDEQAGKSILPLADSLIDGNDLTKNQLDDLTLDDANRLNPDLDDLDQYGGPGSIFNSNGNLDDMMLDDYAPNLNLEMTPGKLLGDKNGKDDFDDDSDEEDEEDEDGNKKSTSLNGKSPSTSPKRRHKKRSSVFNTSNNKENKDDDDLDETLTNDPSKNLNKRAKTMVSILNKIFVKTDNAGFFEMTKRNGRKQLVQKFYSLLVLKKYDIIDVSQDEQYGDIIITKGDKFETIAAN